MTERRSSADLAPDLESALANFPVPERDWEAAAARVEARIAQTTLGSTDSALLAAPLPAEKDEPTSGSAATNTPLTNSGVRTQSLADMARRSLENKQAADRELARASLALAAVQRPSAETALAFREAVSREQPPPPPRALPAVSAATASRTVAVVPVPLSAAQPTQPAHPWSKFGLGVAAIALAAGALFWLRRPMPASQISSVQPATTTTTAPEQEAKPSSNPQAAAATAALEQDTHAVDPNSLPAENSEKPAEPARDKALAAHSPVANAATAVAGAAKIQLEEQPAAKTAAIPAAADKPEERALPPDPGLRPADSTGGAIPAKPSSGAVQAALGAVMSGARHCVAGEEAASSATVVFGSDGRVQSVSVSGPASGKPSGACVQAQLSRARVQPFAAASFSVSATVRPD